MADKHSKQANSYFKAGDQELHMLISKAQKLALLDKKVSLMIDENIRQYCHVANFYGSKLVMIATNGSVATQLRFQIPDLLRKFKQDDILKRILEVQCKISLLPTQPVFRSERKAKEVELLSNETSALVADMAGSLEDPKLREIMQRIATRKKTKS